MFAQNMRLLWLATLLSVALSLYALWKEHRVYDVQSYGLLLPTLNDHITSVDRIEMTFGLGIGGTQMIVLAREEGQWRLPQRAGYPARQELVNETLLALADIQKLAPRTALPEWHSQLSLTAPENLGAAIRFRLSDAAGTKIAEILLGEPEQSESEQVQETSNIGLPQENFYIRLADDNQSWLARGRLPRNKAIAAWIDPDFPIMPREEIVALEYAGTVNAKFARQSQASKDKTKASSDASGGPWSRQVQLLIDQLVTLRPMDVALAESVDFSTAQNIILTRSDGTTQHIRALSDQTQFIVRIDDLKWVYQISGEARTALFPILSSAR